jgi:hypothetical protein
MSQDNAVAQQQQQPQNGTPKHPSLDSQRRRPSSIAEQAMRKLGLGTHQRYNKFFIYRNKNLKKIFLKVSTLEILFFHF